MLESSVSAMGWAVSNYLISGVEPLPMGDQNATAVPSGTFDTADQPINIAANRQEQFETLCELIGRADLLADRRFAQPEARKHHRSELNAELTRALRSRTAAEWERLLAPAGVPAARILTVPEALASEQLAHREFLADVAFPAPAGSAPSGGAGAADRRLRVAGNGVLVDGRPLRPTAPPPRLGQHNAEVRDLIEDWRSASAPRSDAASVTS
jgi:crotonobetainyl-CoA:carnitine CoA-transferase CaiB-like acyl-CoA transferase